MRTQTSIKRNYTLFRKGLYFDLQTFKLETCLQISWAVETADTCKHFHPS